jgi:signal transduction histidine kinase
VAIDEELLLVEREDQLRQLEDSRRRIVAEADRVRRTLEHDLHDGAQQHLVTLALSLRVAQLRSTAPPPVLEEAEAIVVQALEQLREVAHGVYPSELTRDGLVAALENVAEESVATVELRNRLRRRPPTAVESAAYFAVVDSLQAAEPDSAASVDVAELDGSLLIVVEHAGEPAPGSQLRIEDRVAAVGGTCTSRTRAGRTRIEVTLPCGS